MHGRGWHVGCLLVFVLIGLLIGVAL